MKKKLEYSDQILSGLINGDSDQIRRSAKSMDALNQIENWVHASRPGYRTQLANFRDANEKLIAQADDDDLDGAALAYIQLTLSCVNCHKLVRDAKTAKPSP
jgi:cytochrome c556